jgi:hypothetical protein
VLAADYGEAAPEPAPEHYDELARRLDDFLLLPPDGELVV